MKKFIFFPAIAGLFLCSCNQSFVEKKNPDTYPVSFYLQLIAEIIPFPESKSIPPFPAEPETDLPDPLPSEDFTFEYIDYVIFEKESKKMIVHEQLNKNDKEEDDYGFYIYESLPEGEYIISVLTHSSTETDVSDDLFYVEDMDDTFLGIQSFSIHPDNGKEEVSIILFRKVSRIEFIPTDNIPTAVYEFRMNVPERYNTIHLLTGQAGEEKLPYEYTRRFTEEEKEGFKKTRHAFYTFVPAEADNYLPEIRLSTHDEEGLKLGDRKIQHAPIYENRITRYTGRLYSSVNTDGEFSLEFSDGGKWGEPDEHTLP